MSTVRTLLWRLIDDAAVFPPGNAAVDHALPAWLGHRWAPYADLVGRFLCPVSKLDQALAVLPEGGPVVDLGLIGDTGLPGLLSALPVVSASRGLTLGAVEVLADPSSVSALPTGVPAYVEVPLAPGWEAALDVLASSGAAAKLRTGGLRADLFPTPDEVGAFITGCVQRRLAFKCTAGLHNAVRHTDPETGFEHHGFLNVLLAVHAARTSGPVAEVLASTDGPALAAAALALDEREQEGVRELFSGFGSCSMIEPTDDLVELGLL